MIRKYTKTEKMAFDNGFEFGKKETLKEVEKIVNGFPNVICRTECGRIRIIKEMIITNLKKLNSQQNTKIDTITERVSGVKSADKNKLGEKK